MIHNSSLGMGKTLESPRCLCHRFLLCYCRSIYLLKNNIQLKRNWRHQSNFHNQYNCFWTGSIFGLCFLLNVTSCESGLRTEAISIWTVISWQSRIGMDLQMDFRVSNRDFHEIWSNTEMAHSIWEPRLCYVCSSKKFEEQPLLINLLIYNF